MCPTSWGVIPGMTAASGGGRAFCTFSVLINAHTEDENARTCTGEGEESEQARKRTHMGRPAHQLALSFCVLLQAANDLKLANGPAKASRDAYVAASATYTRSLFE